MYEELVRRLRRCSYSDPNGCEECRDCPNVGNLYECKQKLVLQAADAIEELSKLNCISVEERQMTSIAVCPPTIYKRVVLYGVGFYDCGYMRSDGTFASFISNPTHWAELPPEPPKEET